MPRLIKSDNRREPFDEQKIRSSMHRALEKRPVSADVFEESMGRMIHKLRTMGEREVPSRLIGELVMKELRKLDEVAYVRFASVYKNFKEAKDFEQFIGNLDENKS